MSRVLGFLTGSVLVFFALWWVLGDALPGTGLEPGADPTQPVVPLQSPRSVAEQLPVVQQPQPAAATVPWEPAETPVTTPPNDSFAPAVDDGIDDLDETQLVENAIDVMAADDLPAAQWFAIWQPFHSQYSADAFAARLEQLTGLDYQVVKSAPATYEVAVAFYSEQERVENLALIEEATGLKIAGGSL